MQLFGFYKAGSPSSATTTAAAGGGTEAADDEDQQSSWRDGVLTRIFKQIDKLDNVKEQNKHPDIDPTQDAVSW